MRAGRRAMNPTFFQPYSNKDATSGWKKYDRRVRRGETAFDVWAPVRRRPTEDDVARCEAAGLKVVREDQGRPAVQVSGSFFADVRHVIPRFFCAARCPGRLLAEYANPAAPWFCQPRKGW
jgi:hypothetical protein